MKPSTFVIKRNVIIEYHLLGFLVIIGYFTIGLPLEVFWGILSVLCASGFILLVAELLFHVQRPVWYNDRSILSNQNIQFSFNLTPYLFMVVVTVFIETCLLNHPLVFVEKAAIAMLSMGFYIATGIALEAEYGYICSNLNNHAIHTTKILSAKQKSRYFLLLILGVDWLIFTLLYFDHHSPLHYSQKTLQAFHEILFVSVVISSFSVYLFHLYNRNFTYILEMQLKALRSVEEGKLDVTLPIVSNDELALLAGYHNAMIERLRDRERLHKTLEKSVGANIMNKLLTTDEETLKQGEAYHVAILFCDLRGFTSMGESASAEEVIFFLNTYFANVSGLISQHNGIINKFMGDAVLAIFGLDNDGNAVEDTVNAALAIINNNAALNMPNEMPPETGIGIDFGLVMGGTIGSDNRYEYTIIGDAVNKASRLEGLSKRLGYSVILSEEAYNLLSSEMQIHFFDLGLHNVRGRNEALHVYGGGKNKTTEVD